MSEPSLELVIPGIGQVVQLDNPKDVALALDAVRDLERSLRYVKTELTSALVYRSQVEGSKTIHFEGGKAVLNSSMEIAYDPEAIEIGLREAGMPEDRIREIVVEMVSYKVNAVRAKQAGSANPAYAAVIEANRTEKEKAASVTVTLGAA
jgi:hypothetical protein